MNKKEMLAMQGTEFTYVFQSGNTVDAYIKKIDLDKEIMSCWSFSLVKSNGELLDTINKEEKLEQACCLLVSESLNEIDKSLKEIKETGRYKVKRAFPGFFAGCPL